VNRALKERKALAQDAKRECDEEREVDRILYPIEFELRDEEEEKP